MFGRSNSASGDAVKMAGIAALGLAAGLAANFGRKLMVQGPSLMQKDWMEALKAEHTAVLKLFDAIEATDDSQTARRGTLLAQIKHALGKHAFEEENVIYPDLKDHGLAMEAERLIVDHGDVKHTLFELDSMALDSPDFLTTIRTFRQSLEAHMHEEEDEIFPAFDAKLTDEQRKLIAAKMNREGFRLA
jgi:hemerythrin superfamily protein